MRERFQAMQEARVRNTVEDRLRTVRLVCERPEEHDIVLVSYRGPTMVQHVSF